MKNQNLQNLCIIATKSLIDRVLIYSQEQKKIIKNLIYLSNLSEEISKSSLKYIFLKNTSMFLQKVCIWNK